MNENFKAIEKMLEEIQEPVEVTTPDKIKKKWRVMVENKTLDPKDLINYFQLSASYFLTVSKKDNASDIGESRATLLCTFSAIRRLGKIENPKQRESPTLSPSLSLSISFRCSRSNVHCDDGPRSSDY